MLETLLADPTREADAVPYRELRGFLFAVLNGPELIPPSEWIPEVFGGVEPTYDNPDQARAVLAELMALNNEVVAPLAADAPGLPPGVEIRKPADANFDADAPLSAWSRGFARGYGWIEESWDGVSDEFGSVITALAFFGSKQFAADVFETSTDSLGELAATTVELFAEAALEYQTLGRSVAEETGSEPD